MAVTETNDKTIRNGVADPASPAERDSAMLTARRVEFGSFADLERLPAELPSLWQGFLPLGSLGMLWGDAKTGKSTLLAGLLGAVERGEPFPGPERRLPATAVWVSEEPEQALREQSFGRSGLASKQRSRLERCVRRRLEEPDRTSNRAPRSTAGTGC